VRDVPESEIHEDVFEPNVELYEVKNMAQNSEPRDRILSREPADLPAADGMQPTPSQRRGLGTLLRVVLSVATIVILMLWLFGTFRRGVIQGVSSPVPEERPAGLATERVVLQTVSSNTEAVGTIQAEQLAHVTSRVVANILEMRVSAGQRVTNGETLVVLDDRDLRHRAEQAQDAVRSADATLAQAQSDYRRDKPLFDQQVITPYDFEHTQTNMKTAEADLHRLQQAAREAEVNLSYAVIRSPFTGVVVDKLADLGELAAPGKPLLTMYEEGRLWLEANVPEELMDRVHLRQVLTVRIDALDRQMRGPLVQVVPSSDPSTRTFTVRVHLNETRDVVPGMFGRLFIPAAPEGVLTVPTSALIRAGQLTMVEVARQGHVERRSVQRGRAIGDKFEVLSGLAPGETVVLRAAPPALPSQNDPARARKAL
jgi:RND family efflux transporter MFP subunit